MSPAGFVAPVIRLVVARGVVADGAMVRFTVAAPLKVSEPMVKVADVPFPFAITPPVPSLTTTELTVPVPSRVPLVTVTAGLIGSANANELFVSAAASLTDALKEIDARFEKQTGTKIVLNLGASSMLARQIEEGAPADVFISADEAQMDRLHKQIAPETRKDLLTNKLVVVIRSDSSARIAELADLTKAPFARIALADPQAVPAGVYAREVLKKAGLWEKIERKIVPAENVRAALAVVEAGNADAAFVYKTDALSSSKVRVALQIPAELAPKIVYPMAILANSAHRVDAGRFLEFLKSDEAVQVFEKLGFGIAK